MGQYIVVGSQNFILLQSMCESLAGRTGIMELLPLSWRELARAGRKPMSVDHWMLWGGYPRLLRTEEAPQRFFNASLRTDVERDVRSKVERKRLPDFNRFVHLCATRVGQVPDLASLARDAHIDGRTARRWLSLLETCYVLFELCPSYTDFGRRLIRSPKLYFYDTGLLCSLLGIENEDDLPFNRQRASIFENAVIVEVVKGFLAQGRTPHLSFWRVCNGQEINLLVEKGVNIDYAVKVTSSSTVSHRFFHQLNKLGPLLHVGRGHRIVAYAGNQSLRTRDGLVLSPEDDHLLCSPAIKAISTEPVTKSANRGV